MSLPERAAQVRFPPYAARIPSTVKSVFVSAGPHAWERARRWDREGAPGLVAPPDADPDGFLWPVEGMNCALIATDMDDAALLRLVVAIQRGKPAVLAVLYGPEESSQMEIVRASDV